MVYFFLISHKTFHEKAFFHLYKENEHISFCASYFVVDRLFTLFDWMLIFKSQSRNSGSLLSNKRMAFIKKQMTHFQVGRGHDQNSCRDQQIKVFRSFLVCKHLKIPYHLKVRKF